MTRLSSATYPVQGKQYNISFSRLTVVYVTVLSEKSSHRNFNYTRTRLFHPHNMLAIFSMTKLNSVVYFVPIGHRAAKYNVRSPSPTSGRLDYLTFACCLPFKQPTVSRKNTRFPRKSSGTSAYAA